MIKSGRNPSSGHSPIPSTNTRGAKLTAVAGALIFTVFLCSSVADEMDAQPTDSAFGEGAYQVFAPSDDSAKNEEDASAVKDDSVWAYLESAIARLIYGER